MIGKVWEVEDNRLFRLKRRRLLDLLDHVPLKFVKYARHTGFSLAESFVLNSIFVSDVPINIVTFFSNRHHSCALDAQPEHLRYGLLIADKILPEH